MAPPSHLPLTPLRSPSFTLIELLVVIETAQWVANWLMTQRPKR